MAVVLRRYAFFEPASGEIRKLRQCEPHEALDEAPAGLTCLPVRDDVSEATHIIVRDGSRWIARRRDTALS